MRMNSRGSVAEAKSSVRLEREVVGEDMLCGGCGWEWFSGDVVRGVVLVTWFLEDAVGYM